MDKISVLKSFLKADPADTFTRFALALEYSKVNDFETSRYWFEEVLRLDPEYVGVYYHLGKLYEKSGEDEKAKETFEKGIKLAQIKQDSHSASELLNALMELS